MEIIRFNIEDKGAFAHGRTPGSKNGERQYQNRDGTWTTIGLARRRAQYAAEHARYQKEHSAWESKRSQLKDNLRKFDDKTLGEINKRKQAEDKYMSLYLPNEPKEPSWEDAKAAYKAEVEKNRAEKERKQKEAQAEREKRVKEAREAQEKVRKEAADAKEKAKKEAERVKILKEAEEKKAIESELNSRRATEQALRNTSSTIQSTNQLLTILDKRDRRDAARSIDLSNLTNEEMEATIKRLNVEQRYLDAIASQQVSRRERTRDFLETAGAVVTIGAGIAGIATAVYQIRHGK